MIDDRFNLKFDFDMSENGKWLLKLKESHPNPNPNKTQIVNEAIIDFFSLKREVISNDINLIINNKNNIKMRLK